MNLNWNLDPLFESFECDSFKKATEACTKATNPKDRLLATINFRRTLARYQALAFSANSSQV